MKTELVTAPSDGALPIDLATAKKWLRVTHALEDDVITAVYTSVIETLERMTNRKLSTQTWRIYLDDFPRCDSVDFNQSAYRNLTEVSSIELPFTPIQSLTSIKYYDQDNNLQTLNSTNYEVDDKKEPSTIYLNQYNAGYWPNTRTKPNAVIIEGVFGHKADALLPNLAMPKGLTQAMRFLMSHWYDNKEAVLMGQGVPMEVPLTAQFLIFPHTIQYFA